MGSTKYLIPAFAVVVWNVLGVPVVETLQAKRSIVNTSTVPQIRFGRSLTSYCALRPGLRIST
jgi:hypothetical protein